MGLSIRRMWIVDDGQIGPKHLGWQVADQNTRTHSHWMSLQKEQEGKYFEAGTLDRDQNRCRCPFNVLKSPSSRSELILFDRFWILKTSYHYKFACALDMATIVCFYCYWTKLGWGNHYKYKLNSFLWRVLEGRVYALGGLISSDTSLFPLFSFAFLSQIAAWHEHVSSLACIVRVGASLSSDERTMEWGCTVHQHQHHQRIISSISASSTASAHQQYQQHHRIIYISISAASAHQQHQFFSAYVRVHRRTEVYNTRGPREPKKKQEQVTVIQWLAMHVEICILEQSSWSSGDLQPR